jgi:predicted ATPase
VAWRCGAWYRRCGYEVIEVPKASVTDRCDFILQALHPC